jgi:3-phenylpropionate/trans-cinnamate dioxygenase ferredoxin subunit
VRGELFPIEELPPGTMRAASIDGIAVVVVHTPDGKVHALRDRCSHASAALSKGRIERTIVGDTPGSYVLSDRYAIRCPRHGYEFDVETGHCLADAGHRVRRYGVTVENGTVVLER